MKKKLSIALLAIASMATSVNAQTQGSVGIGTANPDASAALDLSNDNSPTNNKKGLLMPRVSLLNNTDIVTILNPAKGLIVYNLVDNSTGTTAVTKDTFYFWDGVSWVDIANLDTVKRELFPQVFFLIGTSVQFTTGGGLATTITDGVVVEYSDANVLLNTGNNITKNANNTFTANKAGRYEISGTLNYNPGMRQGTSTNVEFIAQVSTNGGATWADIAKSTGFWGNRTGGNSRSIIISPTLLTLPVNSLFRFIALSTYGGPQGDTSIPARALISTPTGLGFSKTLKIQYLN